MSQRDRSLTANSEKENSQAVGSQQNGVVNNTSRRMSKPMQPSQSTPSGQSRMDTGKGKQLNGQASARSIRTSRVETSGESSSDEGADGMDVDGPDRSPASASARKEKKTVRKSGVGARKGRTVVQPRDMAPSRSTSDADELGASQEDRENEAAESAGPPVASTSQVNGRAPARQADEDSDDDDGIQDREVEATGAGEEEEESIYDPNQAPEQKRDIRQKYRELTSKMNPDEITTTALVDKINDANELFRKVKAPAEAVLDSNFLILTGDMVMNRARKLKIGTDYFDTDEFIGRLKTVISGVQQATASPRRGGQGSQRAGRRAGSGSDDELEIETSTKDSHTGWDKLGALATRFTLRVPPIDFMLGPLAIPQKKKAARKAKAKEAKEAPAERVQPLEIDAAQAAREQEDQGTTELVRLLASVLDEQQPEGIHLLKFVINPKSYTQTVENIFFTSFLVKEGKAAIEMNDQAEPMIYLCEAPDEQDKADPELRKMQIVLEFELQMWEDAIIAFDIKEPVIPHRQYAAQRTRGNWYNADG